MSARTPFFPQAGNPGGADRPPTRNAARPFEHPGSGANAGDNTNAPKLNTSGLSGLKKKNRGSLAGNPSDFGSNGGSNAQIDPSTIPRSATADPHAHPQGNGNGNGTLKSRNSSGSLKGPPPQAFSTTHGNANNTSTRANNPFGNRNALARREGSAPKIMAPVPIAASTPILVNDAFDNFDATPSFSGFKTPAMPGQPANDAHISNGNADQQNGQAAQVQFRTSFTPARHSASANTSGNTTETYVEDGDDHEDSFSGNGNKNSSAILSGLESGPRRVIIDSTGKAIGGTGAQYAERGQHEFVLPGHGINEHGRVFQQQGAGGAPAPGSGGGARQQHAGRKRNREQADTSMQGSPYGMPEPKRLKTGKGPGSARGQPSEVQQQEVFYPQPERGQGHPGNSYESAPRPQDLHSPLDQILKIDAEEFIREHIGLYEQNFQRWNTCSMKEWMTGPDELTGKFAAVLDRAKEAMTEQLRFYASLECKLSNYGDTLNDRKQALEVTKGKVLQESGNVLK